MKRENTYDALSDSDALLLTEWKEYKMPSWEIAKIMMVIMLPLMVKML